MPAPATSTLYTSAAARCLIPLSRARPTAARAPSIPTTTELHVITVALCPLRTRLSLPASLSLACWALTPLAALTLAPSLPPAARATAAAALCVIELSPLHAAPQALVTNGFGARS